MWKRFESTHKRKKRRRKKKTDEKLALSRDSIGKSVPICPQLFQVEATEQRSKDYEVVALMQRTVPKKSTCGEVAKSKRFRAYFIHFSLCFFIRACASAHLYVCHLCDESSVVFFFFFSLFALTFNPLIIYCTCAWNMV